MKTERERKKETKKKEDIRKPTDKSRGHREMSQQGPCRRKFLQMKQKKEIVSKILNREIFHEMKKDLILQTEKAH